MDSKPSTLPDLLLSRSKDSSAEIGFLDTEGRISSSMSYSDLYSDASRNAQRLAAAGLKPESDIVVTSFPDHESHIRILWSCLLAGIPVCPIPPLHPDTSRQVLFFQNIQTIFHGPTLITHEQAIPGIKAVFPDIKTVSLIELEAHAIDESTKSLVFPERRVKQDDIACLMLTSGSTGNSKAVVLHHSNLLSSIRGKIKHHNTTSTSRFLNWISFDHVASVSEAPMAGREKDYININGIKRPSIDIEHFIEDSAIDGVMRSFVYVCAMRLPDTDTETYAVFYQHMIRVEDELSAEDIQAILKTNQDIRNACIIFCQLAPHVIFPLPRQSFVKTSLGKVSRTALMSSYLQGAYFALDSKLHTRNASSPLLSITKSPQNSIEEIVLEAIASALDKENLTLGRSQSVFDMGVSSMHLMRLKHVLEGQLGI
ncbi:acetyl-CoA synthetase-like protein [Fomitiporia mediterranea MF3/22]|uniref:acetyl-CoA synthetase-like protein n=1 Tax=Fomitiporia mediterranea (strain MF3/22) TaxID=694068 RepID=UPI0004408DB7|nr:acetyl-CoA synthetase-like protein [Fomitiporia mediterranea MF3/22]EJC99566.1 acetyl-CoA synthetase-like protein [Fomitiporia mediterranea MF3/22]